jgi:hypothetical protein
MRLQQCCRVLQGARASTCLLRALIDAARVHIDAQGGCGALQESSHQLFRVGMKMQVTLTIGGSCTIAHWLPLGILVDMRVECAPAWPLTQWSPRLTVSLPPWWEPCLAGRAGEPPLQEEDPSWVCRCGTSRPAAFPASPQRMLQCCPHPTVLAPHRSAAGTAPAAPSAPPHGACWLCGTLQDMLLR